MRVGTGAGDVGTGAHRLLFLVVVVVVVVASHVVVAGAHPDGVVHDAVHDRVGVRAAPEPFVPVLLLVLGAEDRAAGCLCSMFFRRCGHVVFRGVGGWFPA